MEKKNSDINKKELRQSISWTCINKNQWRKLNALEGHCFEKRSKSKNKNINQKLTNLNVSEIFENVNQSKKKIKGVKIKGGLQPHAATHTAFIVHAGNIENQLSRQEATKYFSEVILWLKKNLRGSLLHYSMHFDESTPHVHIMFENLTKTREGNFCSFRSLMNFRTQPKKSDREALEIFVRRLYKDVSKNFNFLPPRYNQEVRTLDQYKARQKETLKDTLETLKQQQEEQQQEQKKQEQEVRLLRAEKNNLTIERTRIETTKRKEQQHIEQLKTLKKEQELKLKQQEQELKLKQEEQEKKKQEQEEQEQELKLKQQQQQQHIEQLKQQEQELKQQEQELKTKEQELRQLKQEYKDNIEKLKENWNNNKKVIRTKIENKVQEIAETLLSKSNIDMMLNKEIKLLNGIAEKLKEATTQEEKRTLIENIIAVKQKKMIRLKKGKDKNKEEVIEEIKQEQKQIKKAKRELNR